MKGVCEEKGRREGVCGAVSVEGVHDGRRWGRVCTHPSLTLAHHSQPTWNALLCRFPPCVNRPAYQLHPGMGRGADGARHRHNHCDCVSVSSLLSVAHYSFLHSNKYHVTLATLVSRCVIRTLVLPATPDSIHILPYAHVPYTHVSIFTCITSV